MSRYNVKLVAAMAFDVDRCRYVFTITNSPTQVYQPIKRERDSNFIRDTSREFLVAINNQQTPTH